LHLSELVSAEPPKLREYLEWHGIAPAVHTAERSGDPVGATLLEMTKRAGADLLVLGGYTHSGLADSLRARPRPRVASTGGNSAEMAWREPAGLPSDPGHSARTAAGGRERMVRIPSRIRTGLGGQPGIAISTGMTFATRPQLA
jgi:hypothetical protein